MFNKLPASRAWEGIKNFCAQVTRQQNQDKQLHPPSHPPYSDNETKTHLFHLFCSTHDWTKQSTLSIIINWPTRKSCPAINRKPFYAKQPGHCGRLIDRIVFSCRSSILQKSKKQSLSQISTVPRSLTRYEN